MLFPLLLKFSICHLNERYSPSLLHCSPAVAAIFSSTSCSQPSSSLAPLITSNIIIDLRGLHIVLLCFNNFPLKTCSIYYLKALWLCEEPRGVHDSQLVLEGAGGGSAGDGLTGVPSGILLPDVHQGDDTD